MRKGGTISFFFRVDIGTPFCLNTPFSKISFMPLGNFIEKNHPNLREIKDMSEISANPFVLTIAAPWCPHCKNEFQNVLNPLCKTDLKKKGVNCYAIDGDSEHGRKFVESIKYPLKGFPTTLMCKPDPNGGTLHCGDIVGEAPIDHFKKAAQKFGLL